jgi:hypothetical protein
VFDTLDQATRRAFKVTKVILAPRLYATYYNFAIATRPFLAESPLFAGVPVVCDSWNGASIRFEIEPRPNSLLMRGMTVH